MQPDRNRDSPSCLKLNPNAKQNANWHPHGTPLKHDFWRLQNEICHAGHLFGFNVCEICGFASGTSSTSTGPLPYRRRGPPRAPVSPPEPWMGAYVWLHFACRVLGSMLVTIIRSKGLRNDTQGLSKWSPKRSVGRLFWVLGRGIDCEPAFYRYWFLWGGSEPPMCVVFTVRA